MTTYIKNRIEKIMFSGGYVDNNLERYINELSELRHPSSIEREFSEAIKDIESKKGKIHPTHKETISNSIEKIWSLYPKDEKELYTVGITQQIENGIKVTRTFK